MQFLWTLVVSEMSCLFLLLIVTSAASERIVLSDLQGDENKNGNTDNPLDIANVRTKRLIQIDNKKEDGSDLSCTRPDGSAGICRPVSRCMQEEFKTDFIRFMNYMCVLPHKTVGACCPADLDGIEYLAGNLPAIASADEGNEVILKIDRSENRGCGVTTGARSLGSEPRQTNARNWPWMAYITFRSKRPYCGGVLITNRHVLTAAHCTHKYDASKLFVRLGEYNYKIFNESRTYDLNVTEKIEHGYYNHDNHQNDICILKLHRSVLFNTYVWPICLPPTGLQLTNKTAFLTGWGTQGFGSPLSQVLMEVSLRVWDYQSCSIIHGNTVFEENICAGDPGKDACQKDSGGPLMYKLESGRWVVIGLVSWGVSCGGRHPGIYTRVDSYLDWITRNLHY